MTRWQAIFGIIVALTIICGVLWRLTRGVYRMVRTGETALDRLGAVERQLKPNGHSTPEDRDKSMRDMIDRIHAVAEKNHAANEALSARMGKVERVAGEAATSAGVAVQEATDARRAVNKLAAEVDVYTNAVLTDRARIRHQLRSAGIDLPLDDSDDE